MEQMIGLGEEAVYGITYVGKQRGLRACGAAGGQQQAKSKTKRRQ
jgi:hypothetical protein